MARVLIAAGGTGGHLYPALSLAEALRDRGHSVTFVGGERLETRLVPEAGFELRRLAMRGLPTRISPETLIAGISLVRATVGARRLVRELGSEVLVGFGGYPSLGPALAAGWAPGSRIPVVLHEQNARLTLAHRLSWRCADVLGLSLPLVTTAPARRGLRVEVCGNPLRAAIAELASCDRPDRVARRMTSRSRLGLVPDLPTVLVTGGSQGAKALNEGFVEAAAAWAGRRSVQVLHLTGADHADAVAAAWARVDLPAVVLGYLDRMEDAYAACDLAVCRAGASTVSELAALGVPAVLVPLPFGGYQEANATVLDQAGAARHVPQRQPQFVELLRSSVEQALEPDVRELMSSRIRELGRPDAAIRLAQLVESVL